MALTLTVAWRCALAIVLITVIVASACARPPRQRIHGLELSRLVVSALVLYATGAVAALTHHDVLAALVSGAGIGIAALAAWMSRGSEGQDPPPGHGEPHDEQPPPEPDGMPRVDWAAFERAFRDYARRSERSDRPDRRPAGPPRRSRTR